MIEITYHLTATKNFSHSNLFAPVAYGRFLVVLHYT